MSFVRKYRTFILFLMAFVVRLISLNQSLWLDEATTAMAVKTYSYIDIITQFSPADFHPPLYYLVIKLWAEIFGYSEMALRMPSILFSLATGWMIYKVGLFMKDKTIGFWATAFFLFNPLIVYYSQEARMYSMVTFTVAASFYYFLRIIHTKEKNVNTKDFWLMNLFLVVSFYTFYASAYYIGSIWLYLFTQKKFKLAIYSIFVFILPLILISPLLYEQLQNSRVALTQVTNWSSVLGNVSLKNIVLIPIKFTSGRISFEPKIIYYALAGGWMMMVCGVTFIGFFVQMVKERLQIINDQRFRLVYFFVTPLIIGLIFSFFSPMLQYFRFQYLIIFMSLLLSYSLSSIPFFDTSTFRGAHDIVRKKISLLITPIVLSVVIFLGFCTWSLVYVLNPSFHREDWKSLAVQIEKEQAPIYMILSSSDPLKYYAPNKEVHSLKTFDVNRLSKEIIVIPYTADIHGINYSIILQDKYYMSESISFRQLTYERWDFNLTNEN
ncbi:hypothetical protein COY16_04200 [Candidatus Roizmanbacteria bacterium CG_4_10_14_0_2_um_filter_39_13]|uniref:Glycosyltransferase RgtA/B/C/D-like domain-containing protein n=1 Tax=Candidatus Roizmanbacteria bacterium CG_4_10_14_0_2_um_filter_39_13 TaxID=1974825 RepID=A0A2M7TXD6_9BACT|nr:MAG: hypothetical protein COY16_04200 [Candidatus Roizmanbacteria bacterium CG_4_10_14_0_2_um_filter_39_13]